MIIIYNIISNDRSDKMLLIKVCKIYLHKLFADVKHVFQNH